MGSPPTRGCSRTARTRRCCRRARPRAALPPAKSSRHADDLRDAAGLRLDLVGEIELEDRIAAAAWGESAVAEEIDHLPRVALPRDEEHVGDPGQLEELERVVDHRPAPDREQVLVRDARQLAEARRLAAGADEALRLHAGMLSDARRGRATAASARARARLAASPFSARAHRVLLEQLRPTRRASRSPRRR